MPSTLFGMKLMSIHILVLGNSFFKLELDNLWDTNKIQKIGKRDFTRLFFFGIRLVYGGGYDRAIDGSTTVLSHLSPLLFGGK